MIFLQSMHFFALLFNYHVESYVGKRA